MSDKYEWRKREKTLYLPKSKPQCIDVPRFKFITLRGEGSPAEKVFSDIVGTLYSIAYGIKMQPKRMEKKPENYFDFTVYPLEGLWDINEEAKKIFNGAVNKQDFVYELMIRQPDFVNKALYVEILDNLKKKKPNPLLEQLEFKTISEGKCVQMLHLGRYEDEPRTFEKMEDYAREKGMTRVSKIHREIYLSDARKIAPEKLKTVLRFNVV